MSQRRPDVKTGPMLAVEPISPELPFVRPNPLLHPTPQRKPTPPSFVGLPFVPASTPAANDRAAAAAPARGDTVPISTDGPFAVAAPVFCIRAPQRHLVIIAKLTCDLVDGAVAIVREDALALDGDTFEGDEPDAPLAIAGDFAPVKEACDVLCYTARRDEPRPMSLTVRGSGGALERRVKTPRELGPISPYDPGRVALLGTYDMEWFHRRWPHYAEDLDIRYFQAAPGPQRLASATGDESFRIDGIDADAPTFSGRLPGLRPVALVHFAKGDRRLVSLCLDTIAFDADDRRVDLVWRGRIEVSDDDAPEIADVFVSSAGVHEVLTEDEVDCRATSAKRLREDAGADREPSHIADEATSQSETVSEVEEEELSTGDAANDEAPGVSLLAKTPDEVAALMRDAGATDDDIAEMRAAMAPEPDAPDLPPAQANDVRAEVIRRLDANESLEGLELFSADLSDLDFSGQDLSGLDLTGTSFARANLSEATLDEAELSGAVFESANLTGASLKAATMIAGDFTGACLEGADLEEADLSEAVLEGAKLDECNLAEARLYDARARRASFKRAVLRGARAEGARADEADFTEALLDGSVWERASLEGAKLERASLVDVSLLRARCSRASFLRADLTDSRLGRADFKNAFFMRANLFEANLDRADMSSADLRGSSLHGASTVGTNLQGANLDGAITSYSRVGGRLP